MALRNSIRLMSGLIIQNKQSVLELSVQPATDFKNTLMLNYYRNGLLHIFFNEALVTAALCSFGRDQCLKDGVEISILIEEVIFLQKLMAKECVQKVFLHSREAVMEQIMILEERGVIHL
jgi:glycerol-3-phosphate O-acyltransferase